MSKKRVRTITQFSILSSLVFAVVFWGAGHAAAPAGAAVASPGSAAVEKAAKDNKYLFIFFWKDDTQHSRAMRGVFQAAMAKLTATAQSVEIQTDDSAEQPIVERYGVSRAPMPMVLAIAPNGAITKGLPTWFDENQLRQAFVSPSTANCMKDLQERKFVLLCVQRPSAGVGETAIPTGVKEFIADPQYAQYTKVEVLNPGDAAETAFLKSLQVDPQTATPVTVLMSPPSSVVGTFAGDVTKEQLVTKLKAAQSSCGPGCACHH